MSIGVTVSQTQGVIASVSSVGQTVTVEKVRVDSSQLSLSEMADVNADDLEDGAMLIYDRPTSKWLATTTIENDATKFNGGFY